MTANLKWNKCQGDVWGPLGSVDLDHPHFDEMEGVYIIWHGGENPRVVRVGQGVIRDRLAVHRKDQQILRHKNGGLFVTWAKVPTYQMDGVERYLFDKLDPLVGERAPDVPPITVNYPW